MTIDSKKHLVVIFSCNFPVKYVNYGRVIPIKSPCFVEFDWRSNWAMLLFQKLQSTILSPLQELSAISHPDIRQKQLECVFQILHSNGDSLNHGWPLILGVIGAVTQDQG